MSIPVVCPKCSARLNAPDSAAGKRVKCPKCQTAMLVPEFLAVEAAEPEFEVVDDAPPAKKPPIKPKAVVKADVELDDEDDRPRKKRRPADDEDDDRPRKKKKQKDAADGTSMTRTIVTVVLLILLLGVAAWVFYDRYKEKDTEKTALPGPGRGAT